MKLFVLLFFCFIFFLSCKNKEAVKADLFETVTEATWEEIDDTAGGIKPVITITNTGPAGRTVIEWGESVQLLFFPEKYIKSRVLLNQNNYPDTPFYAPSQNCAHEEDTVGFKKTIQTALLQSSFSESNRKKIKEELAKMYFNARFFRNYTNRGDTTFYIIENGVEHFLKFEGRLNYTGSMDKISEGKISYTTGAVTSTFSQQIYIANLAFSTGFKDYIISKEPLAELSKNKINHRKWPGKNIYYMSYGEKKVSENFGVMKPVRKHKLLMATN